MLATIAFILAVVWILFFFVFHLAFGGLIHVLIVVAVIMTIVRISKNPVR